MKREVTNGDKIFLKHIFGLYLDYIKIAELNRKNQTNPFFKLVKDLNRFSVRRNGKYTQDARGAGRHCH